MFYLDSSSYNSYYDSINSIPAKPEVQEFQKNAKTTMSINTMSDNMSLSSISFAPIISNVNEFN